MYFNIIVPIIFLKIEFVIVMEKVKYNLKKDKGKRYTIEANLRHEMRLSMLLRKMFYLIVEERETRRRGR